MQTPVPLPLTNSEALFGLLVGGRWAEAAAAVEGMARRRRLEDLVTTVFEPVLYRFGADEAGDGRGYEMEVQAVAFVRSTLARLAAHGPWKTPTGRRAVAAPVPGEEHDLGLEMVEALLVREGWSVGRAPCGASFGALVARAVAEAPELVCLSATTPATLAATRELIRALNAELPATRVMVGGLAFRLVPERAVRVGADLFAEDARAAIETVRRTFGG